MAARRTGPKDIQHRISPERLEARFEAARAEAVVLDRVVERAAALGNLRAAIREVLPDAAPEATARRVRRYRAGGVDGLVDLRTPALQPLDPAMRTTVRAIAGMHPELGSDAIAEHASRILGSPISGRSVRLILVDLGMARPEGRRPASVTAERVEVTAHPLAGAELLLAVEADLGAVRALTSAIDARLASLPPPILPLAVEQPGARDGKGRFTPVYNEACPRMDPRLGGRFESVAVRRQRKDLRAMRVVQESMETRYRKNLALTLLPIVVEGPRWSELAHWRGGYLESLIGIDYQPSTLDKYARELKYAGVNDDAMLAMAGFWLGHEGTVTDPATGAVILYADAAVKPIHTHHFTRCAKVSRNGRVMPAVSTVTLQSGAGTSLLFRSISGNASVAREAIKLLESYTAIAGPGQARRMIVMDRESHGVALFRELAASGWLYVIPLRKNVVGEKANFEGLGDWVPYLATGDEVRDGWLTLNDSKDRRNPLKVRVVARRRRRTGKVSWYATNADAAEFSPADIVRLYFDRWPCQEHVYRDASGTVGLEVQHGYGKARVANVAVIDRIERLDGQMRRLTACTVDWKAEIEATNAQVADLTEAVDILAPWLDEETQWVDAAVSRGEAGTAEFAMRYTNLVQIRHHLSATTADRQVAMSQAATTQARVEEATSRVKSLAAERAAHERNRTIFTVDTVLDELMTAYKLNFLNLVNVLRRDHLDTTMETETLIRAVLTLPGERRITADTETIRIYPHKRDPAAMEAVEKATASLNKRDLRRGTRALRFELAPRSGDLPVG